MDPFHAKLVAASVGSTVTALTMTPFDVVRTRLQTQRPVAKGVAPSLLNPAVCCQPGNVPCVRGVPKASHRHMSSLAAGRHALSEQVVCLWEGNVMRTERVTGFRDAVEHVWRAEGLRGLWKGAGTSLVIGVPSATAYMLTYDYLLREGLPQFLPSPTYTPMLSGILARSVISSVMSPLELVRTNLQSTPISANTPHTLRSVLASIRGTVGAHGPSYLWRGLGPTLLRDVPFSGIYWAGYEYLKHRFEERGQRGVGVAFVSGALSGMLAATLTAPVDVIKTRRQAFVMSHPGLPPKQSLEIVRDIVAQEGRSALFAGLAPRFAKIAPACGIMIACFEGIGRSLARKESDDRP
ncbi:mitochondrial carrier [Vararia minispora EC-137]|uniref:Mitochondrial carrier n=1 Tax=Vararia minispora EC-137 TaxID=1314806 RepID=A0ACB8QG53_9AGAM|nr:mitochondrial carrier [Vararia minispora EC-137]